MGARKRWAGLSLPETACHSSHLCPGTRGCGIWWVPTGANSLMWSLSRRTSPASSPTHASMGLAGLMGPGSGDWPLLTTQYAWGGDIPLLACGLHE